MVGASNYGNTPVVMAESRALRDGLQEALKFGYSRLDIEGDNSIVICVLRKEIEVPWRTKNVMQYIQVLTQQAEHVQVTHIYREANMAADRLSKFGHSVADTWSYIECDSIDFRAIVQDDRIGRTLVRRNT